MKHCYHCGRLTAGEPLFCNFCGRSYDVKLCPRLHPNPRSAEVCSQCGGRELSTPQPKVSVWWKVAEFLVKVVSGVLLVCISLLAFVALLQRPEMQNGLLILGILLGVLWGLWALLPDWFRKLVSRSINWKERSHER